MRKRSQAREFALQILYEVDLSKESVPHALGDFWDHKASRSEFENEIEVRTYTEKLVNGVIKNQEAIDEAIKRYAENWTLERMACVDRNILRLGVYELLFEAEVPMKVSINEAVELAKRFGDAESSKFVNGVLDKIGKTACKA